MPVHKSKTAVKMEPARAISLRGSQGRNTKAAFIPALKGGDFKRRSIKVQKNKSRKAAPRILARTKKTAVLLASKEEFLGAQEMFIGQAKFYTPESPKPVSPRAREDLPQGYAQNQIILQVRDPWWIYSYWEVTDQAMEALRQRLGDKTSGAKLALRVYDVSLIIFNGKNAHRFFDIEVGYQMHSWYIDIGSPGKSWCVDIGLKLANGEFITIARSNTVSTPLAGPSWITDEEWMVPDDLFARLYGMGFGFGKSSPGKAWQEKFRKALFSGVLASPGMASMASPVKPLKKERKFRLVVNTELIVYGATEADAKVFIQGKEINLRPDGTFSLRFALPDGKQNIPVKAISFDQQEKRTITPVVIKETR